MSEPWADPNSGQQWPAHQPVPMMPPPGSRRPGITTTASVLGFVQAGLAIVGGLFVLIGSLAAAGRVDAVGFDAAVADQVAVFVCVAIIQLAGCGMLIAGSVVLLSGRSRHLYMSGMAVQLALCVTYVALAGIQLSRNSTPTEDDPSGGFIVLAVLFLVMPILGLAFAASASTSRFLQVVRPSDTGR